jgi:hypothetical protein
MSQHIIKCPTCNVTQEADAFRSAGEVRVLFFNTCKHMIEGNTKEGRIAIIKAMGLEEIHRQRIRNMEMSAEDY